MRPLHLKMFGFGPYKEEETIDFSTLNEKGLFVIAGATGAGKTSIFDAMTYALYGEASGEDRRDQQRSLRSDFVNPELPSYVTFDFEIKDKHYRIHRQLPFIKKGNKTETAQEVQLFVIEAGIEVPLLERQSIQAVAQKIEQLLGLTADQFKQLVMLPQGEFRKFLTSSTDSKEEIMRKIFQTEKYAAFVEYLNEQVKIEKQAYNQLQMQQQYLMKPLYHLTYENDKMTEILNQDEINMYQWLEQMQIEQQHWQQKMEKQEQQLKEVENNKQQLQKELRELEKQLELQSQWKSLKQRHKELQVEEQKVKEHKEKVIQIERALPFQSTFQQLENLRIEGRKLQESMQETEQEYRQLVLQQQKVTEIYQRLMAQKDEQKVNEKEMYRLEALYPRVQSFTKQTEKAKEQEKKLSLLRQFETEFLQAFEEVNQSIRQLRQEEKEVQAEVLSTNELYKKEQEIIQEIQRAETLEQTKQEVNQLQRQWEDFQIPFKELQDQVEATEKQWIHKEALKLRQHLVEGSPCPVCGSTTHKEMFEDTHQFSEELYYKLVEQFEEMKQKKTTLHTKLELSTEHLQQLIKSAAQTTSDLSLDALREQANVVHKQLKESEQKKNQLKQMQQQLEALENKSKTLNEQVIKNQMEQREQLPILAELSASIRHLQSELTPEERQLEQFEEKLVGLKDSVAHYHKEVEQTTRMLEQINQQVALCKQKLEQLTASKNKVFEEGTALNQQLTSDTQAVGFNSLDQVKQVLSEQANLQNLKTTIHNFEQAYSLNTSMIKQIEEQLVTTESMDKEPLQQKIHEVEEKYKAIHAQFVDLQRDYRTLQEVQQNIMENEKEKNKQQKKYEQTLEIYQVTRGDNPQRLSFERYIQIDYLEQVIQAANIRFHHLSKGQFQFVRSEEVARRNRQSGLDLNVYDSYTGQTRDVKTMSGGEKFLASLCLSLGMSDVIQSHQGAIQIDTLLIDEGFGTLDEESLRNAIDILIDLKNSGRLIGVISHVEELKQVLPARIDVVKSKDGSSTLSIHFNE